MLVKNLLLFAAFLLSNLCHGQNQVEVHISEIDSDVIAQATFDQDQYALWAERLYTEVERYFQADTANFEVALLFDVNEEGVDIQYASRPFGKERNLSPLKKLLLDLEAPTVRYLPYSFVMIARINQGSANDHLFEPEFSYADDRRLNSYQSMTIENKLQTLNVWLSREVLPMVAYYEMIVDSSYGGVRAVGKLLSDGQIDTYSVEELTDLNPDYWEAVLEMSPGYQIIPFTRVCLHILVGDYAKAVRLLKVISLFSNEDSLPYALHDELKDYLTELLAPLKSKIDSLAMKRRIEGPEATSDEIDAILDQFPNYPQVQLEHAFTVINTDDKKESQKQWQLVNEEIAYMDPLFHPRFHPSSKLEAYQFARSREASQLFKNDGQVRKDLVAYADIALDCEDYGLAGHLYWLILNYFDKEKDYNNRNILAHFLYCMNELGHPSIIAKFKGDFSEEFKTISKLRKKRVKQYKSEKG